MVLTENYIGEQAAVIRLEPDGARAREGRRPRGGKGLPRRQAAPRKEEFKPVSVKAPSSNNLAFRLRCFVDLQLATIVQALKPAMAALPVGDILDVGAGESPWREWLPAGARYVGVDIDNADEFGMSQLSSDVQSYDGATMPFKDRKFDGGICVEVLEHASDPDALLGEIARVLKPGAPLLLTTPWSARRHHIPFDFHRFTRERLQQMLEDHGFVDVVITERGDDTGVVANKLVVLTLGCLQRISGLNALILVPLSIVFAGMSAIMLLVAHLPRGWRIGSLADPLGYFCRGARRLDG
jgi:SAM-dependent methyltransferase